MPEKSKRQLSNEIVRLQLLADEIRQRHVRLCCRGRDRSAAAQPQSGGRHHMSRPPVAPEPDEIRADELEYYEGIVESESNRGALTPDGKVLPYYRALLNSPAMGFHISALGRLVRQAGDYPDSCSHADREWVDQVLSQDWGSNTVLGGHIPDALARGVRVHAIIALREGREQDLTEDEQFLTEFVRQVRDGRVTDESYARMTDRIGRRGAAEYTILIMFLVFSIRLVEALTGSTGPTDTEVTQILNEYMDGTRAIPSEALHVG
jgi:hypothetical protein